MAKSKARKKKKKKKKKKLIVFVDGKMLNFDRNQIESKYLPLKMSSLNGND